MIAGGNSGPAMVPGPKAADSRLLKAVAGLDPDLTMPPDGKTRLTADQVGTLRAWIEQDVYAWRIKAMLAYPPVWRLRMLTGPRSADSAPFFP